MRLVFKVYLMWRDKWPYTWSALWFKIFHQQSYYVIYKDDEEECFQSLGCKTLHKTFSAIREQIIIRDEWRGLIRLYSAVTESNKPK